MEIWIAVVFLVLNGQPTFWSHDYQFKSQQRCNAAVVDFMKEIESKGIPQAAGACVSVRIGMFV